jgi:carboxylesterase type B
MAPTSWRTGVKDLASSIAWTKANIARYGGDPNSIVLFGHSAGATEAVE